MNLSGLSHRVKLAFQNHRSAFYSQYVPIRQCTQPKVVNKVAHFGLPVLLIIFTTLYGTFGLPYECSAQNDNWLAKLATDPHVMTHQLVPKSFWVSGATNYCFRNESNFLACSFIMTWKVP